MIPGIHQQQAIQEIVAHFQAALIRAVCETGYAHIEVDCSIIDHEKDIVRVVLLAGTKHSVTVSRKQLAAHTKIELTDRIERMVTLFRSALIRCITETGYAHIEVDCSIINPEKDIVRVVLMVGTKYSVTFSRKQLVA